ncbi:MAG TPA: FUSC family protein, partial [Acetobacteraceae bacterium]|nr:FUSC family protein [Acetobacteraceae bacterium]
FRMVGTLVGAVAIVALTACFIQDRAVFLLCLALWGAACTLVATVLRNFAAYSAALAGYTAAIIASDQLGATGGLDGQAFMLAVTRASEICIGIVSAGVVLAGTDFGTARRRLARAFAALSADIAGRFTGTLAQGGSQFAQLQPVRRELVRRVIALDPVIDEVLGESSQLRYHSSVMQAAVDGLLSALAGWRTAAVRLTRLPDRAARQEADVVLQHIPRELRSAPDHPQPRWMADPIGLRRLCDAAERALIALPAREPSLRLLADQTGKVLAGMSHALDGLALLVADPARRRSRPNVFRLRVPDWLPSLVNAGRTFIAIGAVEVFWVVTAWPSGASAITWTAISVILFAPRADQAYQTAMSFMMGTGLAVIFAAITAFALLPTVTTFAGFSFSLGLYLVPVGVLMAQPWQTAMFAPMAGNFVPLLAPANQMSYDPGQFYNGALGIAAGCGAAVLSFRLIPPLSPAFRARRLLALSLRDLRRVARGSIPGGCDIWERRVYGRLSALPAEAEPLQRAQLMAALAIGAEIIQLRQMAPSLGLGADLDAALEAFAQGSSATATERLRQLEDRLASRAVSGQEPVIAVRARSRILAISDTLAEHASYFDAGAPA